MVDGVKKESTGRNQLIQVHLNVWPLSSDILITKTKMFNFNKTKTVMIFSTKISLPLSWRVCVCAWPCGVLNTKVSGFN